MNFDYLKDFNPLENVEFRDPENRVPFWAGMFDDDSKLKRICWHYRAYAVDFVVEQVGPNGSYDWVCGEYSGSAPTLREARSAARNTIRSAVIGEARRRYRAAIGKLSQTEGN